jgi:hypothetical protein
MSLPNWVGIEPGASRRSFSASDRLLYKTGKVSKRGRTGQIVGVEKKVLHVDELAEFGGD